jgi:hypothetical protein
MALSPVVGKYEKALDRESAFEQLAKRREGVVDGAEQEDSPKTPQKKAKNDSSLGNFAQQTLEGVAKHFIRGLSYRLGNQLIRGIMGSLQRK